VTQPDADKLVFYRKAESAGSTIINFERVTIDRATRQVTSELIWPISP
jgi:hypothetical protein